MFLNIKKHFLPLLLPAFTLFTVGYAEDWAPDSLEGKLFKVTMDDPGGKFSFNGNEITLPSNKMIRYAYVEEGLSYWGFDQNQMIAKIYHDYKKTGPKTLDLSIWFAPSKATCMKGSVTLTNQNMGIGTFYPVIDMVGHPLRGENPYGIFGTLSFELIDMKPSLPREVTNGQYSNSSDWIMAQGDFFDGVEDSNPNHFFKYKFSTSQNWSFEWVSTSDNTLWLDSSEGSFDFGFHRDHNGVGFSSSSAYSSSSIIYPIGSSSFDKNLKSAIRVHYKANGRKFTMEFDENQNGTWFTFLEGNILQATGWQYHSPTKGTLSSKIPTKIELLPGMDLLDIESIVNTDLALTQSLIIQASNPTSLTFAVGNDTLDDITSSNLADFATAGTVFGGGWRLLDWFRYYYATSTGWLFHLHHEWVYPVATNFDSVWLYSPSLGWLWTNQKDYPWTWFNTGQVWKFYRPSTDNWVSN